MEFQQFAITIINTAMVMATVLLLRERVAKNRRKHSDDQELIMDLSKWEKKHIPFWKRKSKNQTFIVVAIIGVFFNMARHEESAIITRNHYYGPHCWRYGRIYEKTR